MTYLNIAHVFLDTSHIWAKDCYINKTRSIVKIRNTVRIHNVCDRIRCAGQGHSTKTVVPAIIKADVRSLTHLAAKECRNPISFLPRCRNVQYDAGPRFFLVPVCQEVENHTAAPDSQTFLHKGIAEKTIQLRVGIIGELPVPDGDGTIVVATGGTSDMPVAEETALTAEALGNRVVRLYDVGVSGIHRLLRNMEPIMQARCIVAVAGMEGALPAVIGGLADCPVIAVPTSVGYGASLGGIAALLSMLNACASGVSVVNIDNGFGGGYMASLINHLH